MYLKMPSAEIVCCKELPKIANELGIETNSLDSEQKVWSGSTLFAIEAS